jgi:Flp pilus assembly protein TadD
MNNPVETAEYYYKLGRSRYEQRDCHAAVQLLREAVKLDSTRPHYHYFLGVALSIISQARHDKHHDGCHVTCKLGKVLVSNPRLRREAEQHLLRAAELDPTSAQIRLRLGYLYKDAELPKRAEYYFREALMLDPTNQTAQRELDAAVNAKEA